MPILNVTIRLHSESCLAYFAKRCLFHYLMTHFTCHSGCKQTRTLYIALTISTTRGMAKRFVIGQGTFFDLENMVAPFMRVAGSFKDATSITPLIESCKYLFPVHLSISKIGKNSDLPLSVVYQLALTRLFEKFRVSYCTYGRICTQ